MGLYLYCISVQDPKAGPLIVAAPALDGGAVRVITCDGLAVAVHACPVEPYHGSEDQVRSWIQAHNDVVTEVWKAVGTVLPMSFDSIIAGDSGRDAETVLADWIDHNREALAEQLKELSGKVELGVRVYSEVAAERGGTEESARGREYFRKQVQKRQETQDRQARRNAEANRIFDALSAQACAVRVNPPNPITPPAIGEGRQEMLNVSVLVDGEDVSEVGESLDEVCAKGYAVHFTGPWPPYSFAGTVRVSEDGSRQ